MRKARTRVRSMWRRNWMPSPLPLVCALDDAGDVGDDEGAMVGERDTPRLGLSVVNG
jgi:hypothetical protein